MLCGILVIFSIISMNWWTIINTEIITCLAKSLSKLPELSTSYAIPRPSYVSLLIYIFHSKTPVLESLCCRPEGIPNKEAKAEIEIHLVTAEAKTRNCSI